MSEVKIKQWIIGFLDAINSDDLISNKQMALLTAKMKTAARIIEESTKKAEDKKVFTSDDDDDLAF